MNFESFIKSRFATLALGAILVVVMLFAGRTVVQKYQIDKEISKLEAQVDKIKKNNEELTYLIKYFNTPDYQEKQAREKLNLKKEGEYVVVLPSVSGDESTQSGKQSESNVKKWFNYFFSSQ